MAGTGPPDQSPFPWFDSDDEIESRFRRLFGREMTTEERRVFMVRPLKPKSSDRGNASGQGSTE